jgi:hypothetical protein
VFRIRIDFNADHGAAFQVNTDPDADSDPYPDPHPILGFDD